MSTTMPTTACTGFGEGLIAFYEGLAADNTKEWWAAHRSQYERDVAEPLNALAAGLGAEFGPVKVFRPYRDVRFGPDKRPYHEFAHLATVGGSGAFYLKVSPDGLLLAGGTAQPTPAQTERWRSAVGDQDDAAGLLTLLAGLESAGYRLNDVDLLKRAPRGWPADHPRIGLLRRRNLSVGRLHEPSPWWYTGELLDRVRAGWQQIGRWNAWLLEHIGPAEEQSRPRSRR